VLNCRLLIIGAGPTGLGAAVRSTELGEDYLLVDADEHIGGMAASVTDDHGFTWDLGGHVLHSHFAEFDRAVEASGVELNQVRRNGWAWMQGRLVPTPVQKNLDAWPTDLRPEAPAANLGEYYRNNFGADLYQRFLEPHSAKMWAAPLDSVDHAWTSLRSGSGERNVAELGLARDFVQKEEYFPYPVGGNGALWDGLFTKSLDPNRVLLGARVVDVDLARRVATLDDGRRISYEHCVSTAPILTAMDWAGVDASRFRHGLVASKVYAIGLGFAGQAPESLRDKTWLYSPDADVPWYRATMLSNYDQGNAGEGRWNVLCEVSTSAYRPLSVEQAVAETVAAIARLGADLRDLATVWRRVIPMGYPVPTTGRDEIIHHVDDLLIRDGVRSRGRFGGWRYESCNQDFSFMQGVQAVDGALFDAPEDVFWQPERF
jgi:protoporphyrinogen oxidase